MLQGATQRTFNQLSFGQRAAVILMMVIQNTDAECLLLDQPEDHLDVSSIVGIVGPTINAVCERKAVCIATHNNNLVLGLRGAIITSLQSQGEYGTVVARGPLVSSGVMTEMLRILEGGEESFFRKIEFYGELSRYVGRSLDGAQLLEIGRELRQRTVDELRNLLQPIVTDSALLKTARHELRNILGVSRRDHEGDSLQAILSRSPAGAGMAPADTLVEHVEKILRNWDSHIEMMLAGIDQMRAVDATPKAMQIDLWGALQEVVHAEVRAFGDSRRKRLSIEIDDDLRGVYIHFDAAHLRLALENLIRNALAATGEVSFQAIGTQQGERYRELIAFRLEQLDWRNKYASVYLIDNGIGLSPADACKIYKEKGFTRRPGGQGIGCQIITRFLAVNGGSINVVQTRFGMEDGGTTQEIRLPLAKVLHS